MDPIFASIAPTSLSPEELDGFLEMGWFRMGLRIFTTSHVQLDDLYRVHWLRFRIASLRERPSHRRIRRRHAGFRWTIEDLQAPPPEHVELYACYRDSIDFDGPETIDQALFDGAGPEESPYQTKMLSVFDGDRLIAGGYFDVGAYSAASILHFYDPGRARCSPGKHLILLTLDYLRSHGFQYYYPGYVFEGHPKMDYKLFLGAEHAERLDQDTMLWQPS